MFTVLTLLTLLTIHHAYSAYLDHPNYYYNPRKLHWFSESEGRQENADATDPNSPTSPTYHLALRSLLNDPTKPTTALLTLQPY
jgi:hypothetical protein